MIHRLLGRIKWSWLDYSPEKGGKWSVRVFLHVTISYNYLHQYNYPMLSRCWWPALPQHYSYSSSAGQKIAMWAEVLFKDNKGCVQRRTILSFVWTQHRLRTVVPCGLLDKSKWHVDKWLSWVFRQLLGFRFSRGAGGKVREKHYSEYCVVLTRKWITAMGRQ